MYDDELVLALCLLRSIMLRGQSRPKLLHPPLSLALGALSLLYYKRVSISPRFGRVTDIRLLDLFWFDNDNAEVRPCDRIVQVCHFLRKLMVLVRLAFHQRTWWRVPPRTWRIVLSACEVKQPLAVSNARLGSLTPHSRTTIPKMRSQLLPPTPLLLLAPIHNPHPLSNFTLHSPNPTALLTFSLDIPAHHKRLPFYPPLRPCILDPPYRFYWPPTSAALHLLIFSRMPSATGKYVSNLLHSYVCRKGGHIGRVSAGVLRCVIVFVLGQLAPHASIDAVAEAGDIGCW